MNHGGFCLCFSSAGISTAAFSFCELSRKLKKKLSCSFHSSSNEVGKSKLNADVPGRNLATYLTYLFH